MIGRVLDRALRVVVDAGATRESLSSHHRPALSVRPLTHTVSYAAPSGTVWGLLTLRVPEPVGDATNAPADEGRGYVVAFDGPRRTLPAVEAAEGPVREPFTSAPAPVEVFRKVRGVDPVAGSTRVAERSPASSAAAKPDPPAQPVPQARTESHRPAKRLFKGVLGPPRTEEAALTPPSTERASATSERAQARPRQEAESPRDRAPVHPVVPGPASPRTTSRVARGSLQVQQPVDGSATTAARPPTHPRRHELSEHAVAQAEEPAPSPRDDVDPHLLVASVEPAGEALRQRRPIPAPREDPIHPGSGAPLDVVPPAAISPELQDAPIAHVRELGSKAPPDMTGRARPAQHGIAADAFSDATAQTPAGPDMDAADYRREPSRRDIRPVDTGRPATKPLHDVDPEPSRTAPPPRRASVVDEHPRTESVQDEVTSAPSGTTPILRESFDTAVAPVDTELPPAGPVEETIGERSRTKKAVEEDAPAPSGAA
ncbi:MAG: hypothetical protein M3273_07210, partial [Actinomycetota bacterium]|nr:hypothetical protein [Actinomycetota bacterium]